MWIHKDCGGVIDSGLRYSDLDNDYYLPTCERCFRAVEANDVVAADVTTKTLYVAAVDLGVVEEILFRVHTSLPIILIPAPPSEPAVPKRYPPLCKYTITSCASPADHPYGLCDWHFRMLFGHKAKPDPAERCFQVCPDCDGRWHWNIWISEKFHMQNCTGRTHKNALLHLQRNEIIL